MSDSVTVRVAGLNRRLTPHELREATVRDYVEAAAKAGLKIDRAALERQAVADCEMADAFKRAHPIAPKKKVDANEHRAKVERDLHAMGAQTVDLSKTRKQRVDGMHTRPENERARFRNGRVAQICRGATSHPDRAVAYSTCEIPHLAYALWRVKADFAASFFWKPRPGDEPNDFFGLSLDDKGRLLIRKVEDICDLSTGRLGPWAVPK